MTKCRSDTVGIAEGELLHPSAFHALMVNVKTNAGIYKTETVKCFCGADNCSKVTSKDRHGINYNLCLCNECGILYANPRMTEDSFKAFYNDDYRALYVGDEMSSIAVEKTTAPKIQENIFNIFKDFEYPLPKVVFEIGCGNGDILYSFTDCEKYGVDYDLAIVEKGKEKGRNLIYGGIEELEKLGKKADLIIMGHVLEHLLDIEGDLKRIRELLSDNGLLYISVPGLYRWDRTQIFQNAHTYQFNGNTLWYMMRCCGFDDLYLSEDIESVWVKSDFMDKKCKNPEEARCIESYLTNFSKYLIPNVRVSNKFSTQERKNNIKYTLSLGIKEITELVNIHSDSEAVIICGGPSIGSYADKIKELQKKGAKVYAIERMYSWCLDRDIIPDYVIAMDAADDVIESFEYIHKDTTHILMAQCKPEVFNLLKDKKLFYFCVPQKGIDHQQFLKDDKITMINAQGSVSLGVLSIAITLGARKFHIFGFDCHVTDKNYADGITGVGDIKNTIEVEVNGKTFKTTAAYFAFMQQFFYIYQTAKELGQLKDVKIYGNSMIKAAAKIDIDGDKNE